jgi:hypothetical protein
MATIKSGAAMSRLLPAERPEAAPVGSVVAPVVVCVDALEELGVEVELATDFL